MKYVLFCIFSAIACQGIAETKTNLDLSYRYFWQNPGYLQQITEQTSLSLQTEMHFQSTPSSGLSINFFGRYDSADQERNHVDVRELLWQYRGDRYQLDAGIGIVYWGVAESQHLVNVINQRDSLEDVLGNVALGQPLVKLALPLDTNQLEMYLLPFFRERSFSSIEGRLRPPVLVNSEHSRYESDREQEHLDYAVRYSGSYENIDYGLAFFQGTQRDPILQYDPSLAELYPYYQQMKQVGADVQYTLDAWLLKSELLYREITTEKYSAAILGFEKSFYRLFDSYADMAWIAEYNWDERGSRSLSYFQDDLFMGMRWSFNNVQSTELLLGCLYDLDYSSNFSRLKFTSRLGKEWTITLEAYLLDHVDRADLLTAFKKDDFAQLTIQYYF